MNFTLRVRRRANRDIEQICEWYDSRRTGYGESFKAALYRFMDQLQSDPYQFGEVIDEVRQATLTDFPYAVYYKIVAETISVFAIVHTSRDPSTWRSRI